MSAASDSILGAMVSHWRMKLCLGAALTAVFLAGYFAVQRYPLRPPSKLPLTAIDRAVPFSPRWVWVYESMNLMLPLAWLARTREELWRYAAGLMMILAVGVACFILYPVAGPRPAEVLGGGLYAVIASIDSPLNCLPSLHLALATYSACVAFAVTGGAVRGVLRLILPVWIALIAYSTLATKQHYLIDLAPGIVLGWGARRAAADYFGWLTPVAHGRLLEESS